MPAPKRPQRGRRKPKKNIPLGQAHIKTSFNNTIVSLTDREGNVIAWESAGGAGFKGSRKSTPFAAQVTADAAARKGLEQGLQKVDVYVKGPGSGRETAIRSLQAAGLEVTGVRDVTPQAHNGCRPRQAGITGENLLALLECRLDNVLVRLGFAASRRQARQLIRHGHWTVNGRRVNIPSHQAKPGDVIAIKADTPATQVVRDATELTGQIPAWLQADHESLTAKVLRKPERREVAAPVQEQLIVELYSK